MRPGGKHTTRRMKPRGPRLISARRGFVVLATAVAMCAVAAPIAHAAAVAKQNSDSGLLAPGYTVSDTFRLSNSSEGAATVQLQAVKTIELENRCIAPEVRAGDTTCEDNGGELGKWLEIDLLASGDGAPDGIIWSGTFESLKAGVNIPAEMAAGVDWQIELVQRLSQQAGNDTMTDRVEYTVQWSMTAVTSAEAVAALDEGEAILGLSFPQLPATGSSVTLMILVIGASLICVGVPVLLLLRRYEARRPT